MIALLFAVLALVVVAGCGSDDDEGGEETLTKVEFIKQGDKICEEAEERSETEAEEFAEENGFELEKASNEARSEDESDPGHGRRGACAPNAANA